MASKFVLTAQLQLQAPTNVRQVVSLVNRQLQGVQMNVNPVVNTKALAQANSAVQKISVSAKGASKSLASAAGSANSLGSALGAAARRFASITLATGFFLALTRALGSAVGRAIEFEKEMLKISQVTGRSIRDLSNLSREVTHLATTLGVGSDEILNAARTLSQAGFSAQKVTGALKILAQTDLAATFDNIKDTTEGAIAILSQFRKEVRAAGGEVAFLEMAMDSINAVSKSFAVESADLISVVRRTGGVFEASGGKLNELIALFTSVRATTRETADTIATGFRTIFTRIQRTETIDSLRELGIVLQDTEGKFVGPMEAIKRLSAGLKALDPRDFRFNQIVEQLGGFRQIGKVIPLIKQYKTSTAALAVANNSMGSTARDAAIAQQGLGNQFEQLKQKFDATIRSLSDSETFKTLATSAIKMAEAILRIVDALEPLLPMLTALAAFKLGQIAVPAFGKFAGVGGRHEGGKIHGFAGGGMVPGRGNRDTVPAMLQPGEFVMRKSAVKKIGANNMAEMNNGYAAGGIVTGTRGFYGTGAKSQRFGMAVMQHGPETHRSDLKTIGPGSKPTYSPLLKLIRADAKKANMLEQALVDKIYSPQFGGGEKSVTYSGLSETNLKTFKKGVYKGLKTGVTKGANTVGKTFGLTARPIENEALFMQSLNDAEVGNFFEYILDSLSGEPYDTKAPNPQRPFDYNTGLGKIQQAFVGLDQSHVDAKASMSAATGKGGPWQKVVNQVGLNTVKDDAAYKTFVANQQKQGKGKKATTQSGTPASPAQLASVAALAGEQHFGGKIGKYAEGGKTDTVAAMLTPGEYVLNKKSAQGIGYSNLHRMNQSNGVNGYAAGGIVTGTRGSYGNGVPGGGVSIGTIPGIESVSKGFTQLAKSTGDLVGRLIRAGTAVTNGSTALGNALTEAAAGITPVDDILREEVMTSAGVLTAAFNEASTGIRMVDDILLEAITASASSLTAAFNTTSAGVGTVDEMLRGEVSAAVGALTAGMINAGTGVSVVDEMLREAVTKAVATLTTGMTEASTGIRKVDDILLQGIQGALTPLENAMKTLSEQFVESDGVLAKGIAGMVELPATVELFQSEMVELTAIFTGMIASMADLPASTEQFQQQLMGATGTSNIFGTSLMDAVAAQTTNTNAKINETGAVNKSTTSNINNTNAMVGKVLAESQYKGLLMQLSRTMTNQISGGSAVASALAAEQAALQKLVADLGGFDALTKSTQQALVKYQTALMSATAKMQASGGGMMAGVGRAGTALQGAGKGVMSGGTGQGMMMAGMMLPMITQMMGLEGAVSDAVTTFGMLVAILPMVVGMLVEMVGSGLAAIAAKTGETAAAMYATQADYEKAVAAKAAAKGAAGLTLFAIAVAAVIAIMTYFGSKAKEAGEAASKMVDDIRSGKGGDISLEDVKAKRVEAIDFEKKKDAAMVGGGIGIAGGAAIGAAIGSFFPIIGTAIGAGIGAIIGGVAGAMGTASATAAHAALDPLVQSSNHLAEAQFYAATAINNYAASQTAAQRMNLKGTELARHQIAATKEFQATNKKAEIAMKNFADTQKAFDLGEDPTEEMEKSMEDAAKGMRDLAKMHFTVADDISKAMDGFAEELISGGKRFEEVLRSDEYQKLLKNLFVETKAGMLAELKASGFGTEAAIEEVDASGIIFASNEQRAAAIAEARARMQNAEATKVATAQTSSTIEAGHREQKARDEAAIAARIELNAKLELARQARATAQALAALDGALLDAKQMTESMGGSIAAANGEFKAVKRNIEGFLKSDDKETRREGFAAAGSLLGPAGAAQAQGVSNKLDKLDQMDEILRTEGLKEFTGGKDILGRQAQSFEELDKFLLGFGIDIGNAAPEIQAKITTMMEDGLDPDEINEIMEMFKGPIEAERDAIVKLVKIQEQYNKQYGMVSDALIKAKLAEIKGNVKMTKIFAKGQERLAEAQGKPLTGAQKQANRVRGQQAGLEGTGVRAGDVRGAQQAIARNRAEMRANAERLQAINLSSQEFNTLTMRQKELAASSEQVTGHLEELADQSARAADIMGDIEKERSARSAVQDKAKQFTFAGNEERQKMNMNLKALQRVLQTGTLASIPDEFRSAVGALLDEFKDVKITRTGMTGGQVSKQLQIQALDRNARQVRGRGLTAEEIKNIFESTTKEDKLIEDLRQLNKEEMAAQQVLNRILQANTVESGKLLKKIELLITAITATLPPGGARPMHGGLIQGFAEGGTTKAARYRSSPKNMFKPRGTDTVPAMLTPGEFVMQKSAVDSIGAANLSAMNEGKPIYRAGGGFVAKKGPVVGSGIQNLLKGYVAKGINDSGLNALARAYNWAGGVPNPNEDQHLNAKKFIVDLPNNIDANFPNLIKAVASVGRLDQMATAEAVMLRAPWADPFHAAKEIVKAGVQSDELTRAVDNLGVNFFPRVRGAWTGTNMQEYVGAGSPTFAVTGTDAGIATGLSLYTGGKLRKNVGHNRSIGSGGVVNKQQAIGLTQDGQANSAKWSMPDYTEYAEDLTKRYTLVTEAYRRANPRMPKTAEKLEKLFLASIARLKSNDKLFGISNVGGAGKPLASGLGEAIFNVGGRPGATGLQVVQMVLDSQNGLFENANVKEKALIAMFDPMGAVHVNEMRMFMEQVMNTMGARGTTSGVFTKNFTPFSYAMAGGAQSQMVAQQLGVDFPPWRIFRGVIGQQADLGAAGIRRDEMGDFGFETFATGGPVGTNWKPQGTDTVPAMLTPGEFVMKKSAVNKYGTGFMSAINGGNAFSGGGYMAEGGSVSQFGPPPADNGSQAISELARQGKKSSSKLIAGQTSLLGAQNQTIEGIDHVVLGVGNIGQEMLNQDAASLSFRDYLQWGLRDVFPDSFATGGPVGVNWQPKGTDTVPAMLTPGEFVMKKSAVNKYGTGFMSAINNGTQYLEDGGPVYDFLISPEAKAIADKQRAAITPEQRAQWAEDHKRLSAQERLKQMDRESDFRGVRQMGIDMSPDRVLLAATLDALTIWANLGRGIIDTTRGSDFHSRNILNPRSRERELTLAGALPTTFGGKGDSDSREPLGFWEDLAAGLIPDALTMGTASLLNAPARSVVPALRQGSIKAAEEWSLKQAAMQGKLFTGSSRRLLQAEEHITSGALGVQFKAMGGPVLPPNQWESNTTTNLRSKGSRQMSPEAVMRIAQIYGKGTIPLLTTGPQAAAYKQIENGEKGRGVWNDLEGGGQHDGLYGNPKWQATKDQMGAQGSLYVMNEPRPDGFISAFALKRLSDFNNVNFGSFTSPLPNFKTTGPFMFGSRRKLGAREAGRMGEDLGLAQKTSPLFASLWGPFAKNWPGGWLPGFDGTKVGNGAFPGVLTYGKSVHLMMERQLMNLIKTKQWNPITQDGSHLLQRTGADWAEGVPNKALEAIFDAFKDVPNAIPGINFNDKRFWIDRLKQNRNFGSIGGWHHFAGGGAARGTDTVPAMLTPGEFVMKKSAVDKYGVGVMSAINNGVQRFATGGPVQYLKNGSNKPVAAGSGTGLFAGVGDIVSSISDSLSAFTTAFSLFSGLSNMLSNTINSMADMTITHKIKIHGTLHIPGFSQSAINSIINTISNEVVEGVDEKIKRAFDKRDRRNDNRTDS